MAQNSLRFAVVGAGGVGGYFGARLAYSGQDVTFLARNATLAVLRSNGLRIESFMGDFTVDPVVATGHPGEIGRVDVILIGVKAWQIPEVAPTLTPLLGPATVALPLQNGVEVSLQLAEAFGHQRVLGGICRIVSYIVSPGVIRHVGTPPSIVFGEFDGTKSERVERLRTAFEFAGFGAMVPENIQTAIWEKALFVSSLGAIGAVARATAGELRTHPETRELIKRAMTEVVAVARARGIAMPGDAVPSALAYIDNLPPTTTTSLHRDIESGRPSELDSQLGAIVRLGREAGVPTPVYEFALYCLGAQERRARTIS